MVIKKTQYAQRNTQYLKNKKILITAGPTWVPIDNVRVISNIATGETGILLAEEAHRQGAKVTLLLGPISDCCLDNSINIIRFKFFDELHKVVKKELKNKKYDIIIHSAAVSDFKPKRFFKEKISSDKVFDLKLKPLPKIIEDIRRLAPRAKLVMFKLESGVSDTTLIKRAKIAQSKVNANLTVANRFNPYRAFIIDREGSIVLASSKNELVKKLLKNISFVL